MRQRIFRYMLIFYSAVLLVLGGNRPVRAAEFELGNSSENIMNGGVLAADGTGSTVYYADSETGALSVCREDSSAKLNSDSVSNINVMNSRLYYVTEDGGKSRIVSASLTGGSKKLLLSVDGSIDEMYVDGEETVYYLLSGRIYTLAEGESAGEAWDGVEGAKHFVPTQYGMIYATQSTSSYTIYADGTKIVSGVTRFYTAEDRLIFLKDGEDYQVDIRRLFQGFTSSAIETLQSSDEVDSVQSASEEDGICEICEENADEYSETGVKEDDLSASTSSDAVSILNSSSVSQGQRNMVKRAKQQHLISWTPLKNITGWGSKYTFYAGTTYTGLPYGQPVYASYVPWKTSLEEFAAAVKNLGSKMYTSKSTYNQTAPYYSCDCSSFVSWAWNLSSRQTTRSLCSYATKVPTQSIYSVEIGDAFVLAGSHTVMVSDIGYSDGQMVYVDIIEQTPPSTKLTRYGTGGSKSLSDLYSKYLAKGYVLYRCKTRDSVTYTSSDAVHLDGDGVSESTKITLSASKLSLSAGSTQTLTYTSTTDGTVSWKSSNTGIAQVSSQGTVTAVAAGKATITLTENGVSASAVVYVSPAQTVLKKAAANSAGGITLSWNSVKNAGYYQVFRKEGSGSWVWKANVTTGTSWSDSSVSLKCTYTYTVRAVITLDGEDYAGAYDQTGLTASPALATPTLKKLTAVSSTSQKLTWSAVTGAEGYIVYAKEPGGTWKTLGTTTKTSYTNKKIAGKKLTTGVKYTYTVRAYYTLNGVKVKSSYVKAGITAACVPATVKLKSASVGNDGVVTLKWNKVSDASRYYIYRKTNGGKWKRLAVQTATTYVDRTTSYKNTYTYTVRAAKKVGTKYVLGGYNKTGLSQKIVPAAPTLKSAVSTAAGTAKVKWKAVSGADGYRIYGKTKGGKWKVLSDVSASVTSFKAKSLASGSTYVFTVRAYWVNSKNVKQLGRYVKSGISVNVK